MEVQCDILVPELKSPKTITLVKENIRRMSDGSSSHCASALNLVLEKAFKLKKQGDSPDSDSESFGLGILY